MNKYILVSLVLMGLSCTSTGTIYSPKVVVEYDSIEDFTYWSHTPVMLRNVGFDGTPAVFLRVVAMCPKESTEACASPVWRLLFQIQGGRLTDTDALTLRIGERRLRPGIIKYTAKQGVLTSHAEDLVYPIEQEDVFNFAHNSVVELRLGGITISVNHERREAVRMLAKRFGAEPL